MERKVFTVDEVNALLPDLEEVFRIMDGLRDRIRQDTDQLQVLDVLWGEAVRKPDNPDREEFLNLRASVRGAISRLEGVIEREVLSRGIRFPPGGLEHGLLDFPTTYEGRWIFLCWRRGEPRIQAWHEVDGGFRGRRTLTEEQAFVMGREGDEGPEGGPFPPGP